MKIVLISLAALAIVVMIVVRFFRGRLSTVRNVSEIAAFIIGLDVEEKPAFFILLAEDGCINRLGRGTAENDERELFIGKTDPAIFMFVRSYVTEGMLQSLGEGYQMLKPRGVSAKLTITFKFKDGSSNGFCYLYGWESEGPPNDVAEFVRMAVAQTQPWYEEFRQNVLRHKQG